MEHTKTLAKSTVTTFCTPAALWTGDTDSVPQPLPSPPRAGAFVLSCIQPFKRVDECNEFLRKLLQSEDEAIKG